MFFRFSNGKVETYVTSEDSTATFQTTNWDGTVNDTDHGSNPW